MITSITTTTTTTTAAASANIAANLGIFGTVSLIILLISKELISSHRIDKELSLSKILNIPISPLLMMFILSVITKIALILS